ncbi:MAG: hypothetical protein KF869_06965 [Phycisphaeraceae bacterium]|nr:hypothetical protein [Phycisphaeraceae bacterium]
MRRPKGSCLMVAAAFLAMLPWGCAPSRDAVQPPRAASRPAGEAPRENEAEPEAPAQVRIASDQPGREAPEPPPELEFHEMFPGVRADIAARVIEFDARTSPLLVADPQAPNFYIETIVCLPDTREHESLLVSEIRPSHLHAALLAAGFVPGAPGLFKFENNRFVPVDPTGDRLSVEFVFKGPDGAERAIDPREWIAHHTTGALFGFDGPDDGRGWVFAGSIIRTGPTGAGVYEADGVGVVVGLCCFGSEVIAWSRAFSHDASIDEPEWIARFADMPAPETPVRVRLRLLSK